VNKTAIPRRAFQFSENNAWFIFGSSEEHRRNRQAAGGMAMVGRAALKTRPV
jgi:hypothetical protein